MKRIWKERPKVARERTWLKILPLDPGIPMPCGPRHSLGRKETWQ
jgi:hypothetical protein